MDDLISRQAAIDAPGEFIKDCNPEHFVGHQKFIEFMDNAEIGSFGFWQFANGFNMGLTAAEVAINELPSAPRWIPCKERLPEEMGDYLVCDNCQNIYVNEWITTTTTWSWHYDDGRITAWMPLPEPWKGEDHGVV